MEDEFITIYYLLDDYIKSIRYTDCSNTKLSTAEVLLIQVIGMKFFYGNVEISRKFLIEHKYIRNSISNGALKRRIHKVPDIW